MGITRVQLATVLVLVSLALGCGDNDNTPAPRPTFTPATFQCSGPEGPPTSCSAGNKCCGNACISESKPCCEVPAGHPDAGTHFSCRSNQICCETTCAQIGQSCS